MVEGPGATRNGRKVQMAVGMILFEHESFGAVNDHVRPTQHCSPSDQGSNQGRNNTNATSITFMNNVAPPIYPSHAIHALGGQLLKESFTLGKELFLIFADRSHGCEGGESSPGTEKVVRLHFGMSGSLHVRKFYPNSNGSSKSSLPPWKKNVIPTLRLYFVDTASSNRENEISFVNSKKGMIVMEAWDTSISTAISSQYARNKYLRNQCRDVCSERFNAREAFHALKNINGSNTMSNMNISDALLNQDLLPGVGNIIKIESLHLSKIDPRRTVSSLSDGELRRIVKHVRKYSMDWLKNGRTSEKLVYNRTVCGSCGGMTVKMQKIGGSLGNPTKEDEERVIGMGRGLKDSKGHNFMSRVTFWCTACQPLQPPQQMLGMQGSSQQSNGYSNGSEYESSTTLTEPVLNSQSLNPTNVVIGPANAISSTNTSHGLVSQHPISPRCPQHGPKQIKLCRVRKSQQNTLRIFFTCKIRGCQYFQWADSSFPSCSCGNNNDERGPKRKAVIRVSKTQKSGGKWFLCCAAGGFSGNGSSEMGKNKFGCGFFEWAKEEHLGPLGSFLTPLL